MNFSGFNWHEVFVAAMSAMLLLIALNRRYLLNSNKEFQHSVIKHLYITLKITLVFVIYILCAMTMSAFIEIAMMLGSNLFAGAFFGALLAVIFSLPWIVSTSILSNGSYKELLINVTTIVLQYALMGGIMGAWQ